MASVIENTPSIQYARWSDPSQAKGASKTRQFCKMREEARRYGYSCQREIFDDGRSAFHGHHIERGELGKLLDEIDAGEYIGWVLQIENIDRLSRQGHEAVLALVHRITTAGMSIRTCDGDFLEAYKRVELDQVIVLAIKAELARKEAEKRSDRTASSWKIRRSKAKEGSAIPGAGPTWIERNGDTFRIKSQAFAAQAARIWQLADETGHGGHTITRLLNDEGTPMFDSGKPWYSSRVDAILSGMEVIGYHQPRRREGGKWVPDGEPIKVYPAIIPFDLYERVRAAAQVRLKTRGGGRSEKIANLFSGLCRCGACGGSMRLAGSTNGGYLMCVGRERGLCSNNMAYRYRSLERPMLDEFLHLAIDESAFANKGEVSRLSATIAQKEIEHAVKIKAAKAHLQRASQSPLSLEMGLEAEAEAGAIAENIRALKEQKESAKGRASAAEHLARLACMRERLSNDIDLRHKVLQAFNTVVESITFNAHGLVAVRLIGGIIKVEIDQTGEIVAGTGNMTLKHDLLVEQHRDEKVISIVRAVTSRFAAKYQEGGANWQHEPKAA
jgi:DNA invertase Pin-like site-specific DNA recombinase